MKKPKTLNELKQLEESGFGQPYPRHGLKLLYWFANDCVYFDGYNNMCWQYDPEDGYFDFHLFRNRIERNGEKLLPDVNLQYYEVGNLNKAGADDLPDYVLEDYNQNPDHCESNMERIIVSVDDECIERVYVTEHTDQADFNKEATYCISRGLIKIIRQLTLQELLEQTGYFRQQEESDQDTKYLVNQREDTFWNDRRSGLVAEEDNDSFRNNTVSENCCKCVIL
ncbi:uncharacterized protein LOC131351307 isoform X2 [Hemibagrus wyckioides]|nr:uncharacterized protein LOC131351307 isoform X2 [Hemibagrus wyckioides]XP_058242684.1 uncharacterized protein LOC131351307 isoform X2 [Hemibagrus wyckioides]